MAGATSTPIALVCIFFQLDRGISTIDRMCTNTGACPVLDLLEFRVACLAALNFSEGSTS